MGLPIGPDPPNRWRIGPGSAAQTGLLGKATAQLGGQADIAVRPQRSESRSSSFIRAAGARAAGSIWKALTQQLEQAVAALVGEARQGRRSRRNCLRSLASGAGISRRCANGKKQLVALVARPTNRPRRKAAGVRAHQPTKPERQPDRQDTKLAPAGRTGERQAKSSRSSATCPAAGAGRSETSDASGSARVAPTKPTRGGLGARRSAYSTHCSPGSSDIRANQKTPSGSQGGYLHSLPGLQRGAGQDASALHPSGETAAAAKDL